MNSTNATRLWHPNDYGLALDSDTSGKRRSFKPDEYLERQMQAAHIGQLSTICHVCGQRVAATHAKPNEQRWNQEQYWTCKCCLKYGDPHGRSASGHEYKHTCADCKRHDGLFYRLARNAQGKQYEMKMELCRDCAHAWWHDEIEYVGESTPHETMICAPGWWTVPVLGTCEVCEEPDVPMADVTTIPRWLRKKNKWHLCHECVAAAKEMGK